MSGAIEGLRFRAHDLGFRVVSGRWGLGFQRSLRAFLVVLIGVRTQAQVVGGYSED